ncbi:MAG: GNAT family N-acetyltransferase [Sphaerochaeta sp.]|nr:GNAT family N-acetyltransferase [Sphaerochaeta sp.]
MTGIRTMEEQDISAVRSLILQLASDLGEEFDLDHAHYLLQYQAMQQHPDIYHNSVYCFEDEVVGFLSLVFYRSFFHKKGTALVNELVVQKTLRNQRIGKALIEHAMAVARELGFDEIEVGVMKENTRALAFYRHNGFDEEYLLLGREFTD